MTTNSTLSQSTKQKSHQKPNSSAGTGRLDHLFVALGLPPNASKAEVKAAYFSLAKKYHPDHNPSPENESRWKEICEAYEILIDDKKRNNYSRTGSIHEQADAAEVLFIQIIQTAFITSNFPLHTAKKKIRDRIDKTDQQIYEVVKYVTNQERRLKKFIDKNGDDNLVTEAVRGKIADINKDLNQAREEREVLDKVHTMLKKFKEDKDEDKIINEYRSFLDSSSRYSSPWTSGE